MSDPSPPPPFDPHRQPDGKIHGVTIACCRDDGRWLLIRRSAHVAAPGTICFPGGRLEIGEARAQAARREFQEEVGAPVLLQREIWRRVCPDRPLILFGWLGRMLGSELKPDPREVAEVLWLTLEEAYHHPEALRHTDHFCRAIAGATGTPLGETRSCPTVL